MNLIQKINAKMEKIKGINELIKGACFGMVLSVPMAMYAFSPSKTYNVDDNGDGKKDLVVKTHAGIEYLFYQTNDGNFEYVGKRQ